MTGQNLEHYAEDPASGELTFFWGGWVRCLRGNVDFCVL